MAKMSKSKKKYRYGTCYVCGKKGVHVVKRTYNPDYTTIKCKYCGKGDTIA